MRQRLLFLMVAVALGLALGGQPLLAASSNPFVGRWQWDGPETCAKDYDAENVAMQITPDQLIFYEGVCTVSRIQRLGEGTYRFHQICKSEGESERRETMFALLKKSKVNDELLLSIEPKKGTVRAYRRCP